MEGCIFLDRDGTINERAANGYVLDILDFRFLPGVLDALAFLAKNSGRRIAVVTNQSCVGRGVLAQQGLDDIHDWMERCVVHAGGRIDEVYVCPHTKEDGCGCRKPQPGLFIQVARDLGIDLAQSVMVGDMATDIEAAWAAGIEECYLVLTGCAQDKYPDTWQGQRKYDIVAALGDAARMIVQREKKSNE